MFFMLRAKLNRFIFWSSQQFLHKNLYNQIKYHYTYSILNDLSCQPLTYTFNETSQSFFNFMKPLLHILS